LFATMEHPTPSTADDCAYLTSNGYALRSLVARSVPLSVGSPSRP
jgi:hypothetical protein